MLPSSAAGSATRPNSMATGSMNGSAMATSATSSVVVHNKVPGRLRQAGRCVRSTSRTASSVSPAIPVVGLVLLLGVDRFLNEARAITNLVGNGLATIAVAKWEGAFDAQRWNEVTGDKARGSVVAAKWLAKRPPEAEVDDDGVPALDAPSPRAA